LGYHVSVENMEHVIPFSQESTEVLNTGQWSPRGYYVEKRNPSGVAV